MLFKYLFSASLTRDQTFNDHYMLTEIYIVKYLSNMLKYLSKYVMVLERYFTDDTLVFQIDLIIFDQFAALLLL